MADIGAPLKEIFVKPAQEPIPSIMPMPSLPVPAPAIESPEPDLVPA